MKTLAIADSDGQISCRVHPHARWKEFIAQQPRWDLKVRATKHFLQHYSFSGQHDDSEKLESTKQSDVIAFGSNEAKKKFSQFLHYYGQPHLDRHLVGIPYPVNEKFCERTVPSKKEDRIVAIARWESAQKDARLFTKALELCLKERPQTEVLLLGPGGEHCFSDLMDRFSRVRYLGVQQPEVVAELLADSRAIVFSSRWESGPIAALEALTLGCTVIGTPIPSFVALTAKGEFGRVSASRRPADLARAIHLEMNAWDEERRDARAIARHWRPKLHPTAVCREMLDALKMVEGVRPAC
jgi:glycosyltransferase involved in cell wall biosynthesis